MPPPGSRADAGGGGLGRVVAWVADLALNPQHTVLVMALCLLGELVLNAAIVAVVPYTEIDWEAYMQEVEGVVNGTYDYTQLRGGTGPLVYPAGFVYIFLGFYYATDLGANILRAQSLFVGVYVLHQALVLNIYRKCSVPPYVLVLLSCSYRIHSIFALRLFNDPIAMLLFYAALNLFMDHRWTIGCVFFSLAVSVKMNVILFAPALLVLLLQELGMRRAILNIALCALIQLGLGAPFLLGNAVGYVACAFNLGRQFFYIWTVNWRCISEELFLNRGFHLVLVSLHLAALLSFAQFRWTKLRQGVLSLLSWDQGVVVHTPRQIAVVMFTANLIGMMFARSLHYQFYVWYFHSLPLLLWLATPWHVAVKLAVLVAIEWSWNVFPSRPESSLVLHAAHAILLAGCWLHRPWPREADNNASVKVGAKKTK